MGGMVKLYKRYFHFLHISLLIAYKLADLAGKRGFREGEDK